MAVVEFAVVTVLLAVAFAGLLQLSIAMYVRGVAASATVEAARLASAVHGDAETAERVADARVDDARVGGLIEEIDVDVEPPVERWQSATVRARTQVTIPLIGPWGPRVTVDGTAARPEPTIDRPLGGQRWWG